LGAGNIGVLASKKGVGKTACLVHIATDQLFQEKHVIHVSFAAKVDHIINWYEDIFKEIAKKRNLESAVDVHDEIIRNRVIMNFNQHGIHTDQILGSLRALIQDGSFAADTVIFDGYDISRMSAEDFEKIRAFAKECDLEIWFSVSLGEGSAEDVFDGAGVPELIKPIIDLLSVVITLRFVEEHVHLQAIKDHDEINSRDMNLMLDPRTLLVAED